jgi:hypothetical protein
MKRSSCKGGRTAEKKTWDCFNTVKDGKKKISTCKTCGETMNWAKVERLKLHIDQCQSKKSVQRVQSSTSSTSFQPVITTAFQTASSFKKRLDIQLGKMVYSTNMPFNVVEHPEFLKFVKMLHPSYKPASAYSVGGPILTSVYGEIVAEAKAVACSKFATLMQDGWSGIQQSPIISHCVSVEAKRTLFIDAVATKTDVKDAAYCCMLLNDAIRSAEEDFECRVGAIITDNCNTMISMKNLISSQKPGIWTYGCQVHLLNLIGKEVASTEILVKVKEVQHFFKAQL